MNTKSIIFSLLILSLGCSNSDNKYNDSRGRETDITSEFIKTVANKTYGPQGESFSFLGDGTVKWKTEAYVGFEEGNTLFNGKKAHTHVYLSCNARIESKIKSVISRKNNAGEQEYILNFVTVENGLDPYNPVLRYETGDGKPRVWNEATDEQRREGIEMCVAYAKKGFKAEEQRPGQLYGISSWGRVLKSFDSSKLQRGDFSESGLNSYVYSHYIARGERLDVTSKFFNYLSGSWVDGNQNSKPRLVIDSFDKKIVFSNSNFPFCGDVKFSAQIAEVTVNHENKMEIKFEKDSIDLQVRSSCEKKPQFSDSLEFEIRGGSGPGDIFSFKLGDQVYYMSKSH